jgi:hypothetical protein
MNSDETVAGEVPTMTILPSDCRMAPLAWTLPDVPTSIASNPFVPNEGSRPAAYEEAERITDTAAKIARRMKSLPLFFSFSSGNRSSYSGRRDALFDLTRDRCARLLHPCAGRLVVRRMRESSTNALG